MKRKYAQLYKGRNWRILRAAQLGAYPLCARCLRIGKHEIATVANHITPHKGDPALFNDPDNLESVCKRCHDSVIQTQENRGIDYDIAVGADGIPIDSGHPFNL